MFWSDLGPEIGFEAMGKVDSKLKTFGVFANPKEQKYERGVVFYLEEKSDKVVGILLWNVFNNMSIARRLLKENRKFDDLTDAAKLFDIYPPADEKEGQPSQNQEK